MMVMMMMMMMMMMIMFVCVRLIFGQHAD